MRFWLRKSLLALSATILMLTSGFIYALGLGQAKVHSELYQPLRAEIALTDVGSLNSNQITVQLATHDDFKRVGMDYQYSLTDLNFRVVFEKSGKKYIEVTSTNPIRESFLHFLIEVNEPKKSFLREYTFLLNIPLYKPDSVTAAAPKLDLPKQTSNKSVTTPTEQPKNKTTNKTGSVYAPITGSNYRTITGDTLRQIVERMGAGKNANQAMLAIVELNPNAFIDGNVNLVKAGVVLRLPDQNKINQYSRAQAAATVREHNQKWRSGNINPSPRRLDASQRKVAGNAPKTTEKDSIRLVADGSSAQQEQLNSVLNENAELKEKLGGLQNQIKTSDSLIKLKDEKLEQLNKELEQLREELKQLKGIDKNTSSNEKQRNAVNEESQITDPPKSNAANTADSNQQPITPKPVPAPVTPPLLEDTDITTQILNTITELASDTLTQAALGGIVVLGFLVFAAKKVLPNLNFKRKNKSVVNDELSEAELAVLAQAKTSVVSHNAISEAESFINYGQFSEAAEVLTAAINESPANTDLRIKLLEVLGEMGDAHEFETQKKQLLAIGGDQIANQIITIENAYSSILTSSDSADIKENEEKETSQEDELFASLDDFSDFESPEELTDFTSFDSVSSTEQSVQEEQLSKDSFDLSSITNQTDDTINESQADDNILDSFNFDEIETEPTPEEQTSAELAELELNSEDLLAELDLDNAQEEAIQLDDSTGSYELSFDEDISTTEESPTDLSSFDLELDETIDESNPTTPNIQSDSFDLDSVNLTDSSGDDFNFLDASDEISTKFELAEAYIEMGDSEGAKEILYEIIKDGNTEQQVKAQQLIDGLA